MNEHHRASETLAAEASALLVAGNRPESIEKYRQAGELEVQAFQETSPKSQRTRSVLAVSLVSLFYKAGEYDRAEHEIFALLASRELNCWAQKQLRELLEVVADERIILEGLDQRYTGEAFTVSLKGGEIGVGTGPLDLVLEKASGFRNLLYRMAECVAERPLRLRGAPPKELTDLLQVRTTQPAVGSYRLEMKLTEPAQPDLFEQPSIEARQVTDKLFQFLEAVSTGSRDSVELSVPDPRYRRALLQLVQNVSPRGKRLEEIALYRATEGAPQAVYLTSALPGRIRKVLPEREVEQGDEPEELRGVLRALHLDENWLELILPVGDHERCDTMPDMLDDVVGPMVNQEVIVSGVRRKKQGGVRRVLIQEIELAEPA